MDSRTEPCQRKAVGDVSHHASGLRGCVMREMMLACDNGWHVVLSRCRSDSNEGEEEARRGGARKHAEDRRRHVVRSSFRFFGVDYCAPRVVVPSEGCSACQRCKGPHSNTRSSIPRLSGILPIKRHRLLVQYLTFGIGRGRAKGLPSRDSRTGGYLVSPTLNHGMKKINPLKMRRSEIKSLNYC